MIESGPDEPYNAAELRRFKRIGLGLETVGPSYFGRIFYEDKIIRLALNREREKAKADKFSPWIICAISETLRDLGIALRQSYQPIETKERN